MSKDTHTDNEDLRKTIINRTHTWIRDCGLDVRDVEAFVDRELLPLFPPTKSSGELEDILDNLALYGTGLLDRESMSAFLDGFRKSDEFHACKTAITTQTTKLQAEARLDELQSLPTTPRCPNCDTPYDNVSWLSIRERIAELEREHKVKSDE